MTIDSAPATPVERTALSRQRTALSVLVAAVVVGRLTVDSLGALAAVAPLLALALSGWVLLDGAHHPGRAVSGPTSAALGAAVALLCLAELAAIVG